jgi:Skp family chaperone for outer membrane proteins
MNTYILDFEEILKNFIPYHESLKEIKKEKQDFSDLIENIKKEMETIANSSKSLILDDSTSQKNQIRFRELQTKAIKAESEFRSNIVIKQNEELEKNFKQIIDIVEQYSKSNNIDLVVNKSSVVYVNPELEITSKIIDLIKEKSLYQEFFENDYQIVE